MYTHIHTYIRPEKHLEGYEPVLNAVWQDDFHFYIFMFLFPHMQYLHNNKFLKPLIKMKLVGQLRQLTNYTFNRKCTTAETKNYLKEM